MKARFLSTMLAFFSAIALGALDAASSEAAARAEIDAYMAKAVAAIESRHLAEGIRCYVSVLAIADSYPPLRPRALEAESALARIATRLTLEPSSDWIDQTGSQIEGSTRGISKGSGLAPAVFLFESFGEVKSPVADASISFVFARNSGSLVPSATTDAYGKANSSVASLGNPGEEARIRAYPEFVVKGRRYAFTEVFRDFVYLPSVDTAMVAALERSEFGTSDDPKSLGAVVKALEQLGIELSPANAKFSESLFLEAIGGKASALASFGLSDKLPYAAFVMVEVAPTRQMEYDGKKYEIYTASSEFSFRLLRSDGSLIFSLKPASITGQGGTREAAVADAYARSGASLAAALSERRSEIEGLLKSE